MKLIFSPTRVAILNHLGAKLKDTQSLLDQDRAKLEELKAKQADSRIHNSYAETELKTAERNVAICTERETCLLEQIGLIESDPLEHVSVELEL